ncbi:hypothetical protein L2E82_35672 [Cichorium intybus]|uniref:Uncharacterized protein n=1 Tax=Cichorium intybus TaxID=13427 RepID=A0ACB9BPK2_CICIN|nr:hypothetical protein L2E82_35672 [Cichorium intybus]
MRTKILSMSHATVKNMQTLPHVYELFYSFVGVQNRFKQPVDPINCNLETGKRLTDPTFVKQCTQVVEWLLESKKIGVKKNKLNCHYSKSWLEENMNNFWSRIRLV